jgi:hypothetical protein
LGGILFSGIFLGGGFGGLGLGFGVGFLFALIYVLLLRFDENISK